MRDTKQYPNGSKGKRPKGMVMIGIWVPEKTRERFARISAKKNLKPSTWARVQLVTLASRIEAAERGAKR